MKSTNWLPLISSLMFAVFLVISSSGCSQEPDSKVGDILMLGLSVSSAEIVPFEPVYVFVSVRNESNAPVVIPANLMSGLVFTRAQYRRHGVV